MARRKTPISVLPVELPNPAAPIDDDQRKRLIDAATAVRERAYAPYSGYQVGAALLTAAGDLITGCNVENGVYPVTICAERTALVKAISDGQTHFIAIAVVTADGGWPCGICRQALYEFAPELWVVIADTRGQLIGEERLDILLPHGFRLDPGYAHPAAPDQIPHVTA